VRVRWGVMVWQSSKRSPREIEISRLESIRRCAMTKVAVREAEGIEGRSGLGMIGAGRSNGFFLQHIRRYGGSPS
jgi:hypothetical protein